MCSRAAVLTASLTPDGTPSLLPGGMRWPSWFHFTPGALDALDPPLLCMVVLGEAMETLHAITHQVVTNRKESRLLSWVTWIWEDFQCPPYEWLQPDFLLPFRILVCDPGTLALASLFNLTSWMPRVWMPYFRRKGHLAVTPRAFFDFVGEHLPQAQFLDLPPTTGEEHCELVAAEHSSAGGLDGWCLE